MGYKKEKIRIHLFTSKDGPNNGRLHLSIHVILILKKKVFAGMPFEELVEMKLGRRCTIKPAYYTQTTRMNWVFKGSSFFLSDWPSSLVGWVSCPPFQGLELQRNPAQGKRKTQKIARKSRFNGSKSSFIGRFALEFFLAETVHERWRGENVFLRERASYLAIKKKKKTFIEWVWGRRKKKNPLEMRQEYCAEVIKANLDIKSLVIVREG